MEVSRRDFLKVSGTSAAGAVLFAGCAVPERELIIEAPRNIPEDYANSFENWYASVCRQCPSGCGIISRVVEGRVKKLEGNPDHPLNRGKLCARGLAGPQVLYHPDRIRTPLRRTGPRGSGQYTVVNWDDALDELASRLRDLQGQGAADTVVLATEPLRGTQAYIASRFGSGYGWTHLAYEPMEDTVLRAAMKRLFNQDALPVFDIERTNLVLSFGANFLEPWISQVAHSRAYGEFRQGRRPERGYLIQIEPRLSMTASNADEWVPIKPGTEGFLALAMAQVIMSENLGNTQAAQALGGAQALSAFTPREAERITGVPQDVVADIARRFARARPALALGGAAAAGHTNGLFNLMAIYSLNALVGNIGQQGGVLFSPAPPVPEFAARVDTAPFQAWQQLASRLGSRQPKPVNMLLVRNANPLYGLPHAVKLGENLKNVAVIVSFSSFMDETTAMADLILPDNVYLESWGDDFPDPGSGYEAVGLQQPAVNRVLETRPFGDVLLQVAKRLGGRVQQDLPWNDHKEAIQAAAQKVFNLNRGSVRSPSFDGFWNGALQRGGWWDTSATFRGTTPQVPALPRQPVDPEYADASAYRFHLVVFPHIGLGDGRNAHLPWMQMTPDPTTTVTWQSWVEMHPQTARDMGLRAFDIVAVESANGTLEVPVYLYPGIPPDVVAMPLGQGHTYMGRYAEKRGANPMNLLAPLAERDTGALAWGATKVNIRKTGKHYALPRVEGVVTTQPEDYSPVQVTSGQRGR